MSSSPLSQPPSQGELSDREWDIQTGHAIDILRNTMPDFFATGLVSRSETDSPQASIYAPNIRLSYTPPVQLPSPLPATFRLEGIPLYHASAVFVRHTLATLYSDLRVEMRNVTVVDTGKRERHVKLGIGVHGAGRVSGAQTQWDVVSTYHFSPATGLINQHTVDSIHPAPHVTVFDALKRMLGGGALTESMGTVRPCRMPISVPSPEQRRPDTTVH
ncbi:hypothetical protein EXIGLDRAFT_736956 [Exidia glandulosa HHB12029]|uniref:Uncharacterized protein n=1 Tax=Exidia glandulosa HHB12029 TaxID=1314781 RepID=A0A165J7U4_EXIGL|nr:hypothetical protein EXIGLDRAFT_736956 [Exidia glandulosa HHB12029]